MTREPEVLFETLADLPDAKPAELTPAVGDLRGVRVYWWDETVAAHDEWSRAHVSERCSAAREEVPEERWTGRMRSGSIARALRLELRLCQLCLARLIRARLEGVAAHARPLRAGRGSSASPHPLGNRAWRRDVAAGRGRARQLSAADLAALRSAISAQR